MDAAAGASTAAPIGASTPPEPYTLMTCAHHPSIQHVPCEGCVSVSGRILCAKARGWRKVKAKSGVNWWCPACNATRFSQQYPPDGPGEPEDCCVSNHGDEDARWWVAQWQRCGHQPPRLSASTPEWQAGEAASGKFHTCGADRDIPSVRIRSANVVRRSVIGRGVSSGDAGARHRARDIRKTKS